jgi:hypothetical protein
MKRIFILGYLVGLLFILGPVSEHLANGRPGYQANSQPGHQVDLGKLPLYFITNKGQVNGKAKFYAKASRYTLWITKEGLVFDSFQSSRRDVSRMNFIGADKKVVPVAVDKAKPKVNYFKGKDKSKWYCNVPTSKAVLYKNLYKNIDLKVYGIEKEVEYDWIVNVGGDPGIIKFQYQNVKGTRIDKEGNLLIETDFGELIHKRPISYQEKSNEKVAVKAQFKRISRDTYGFLVGEYDDSRPLIIDPVVTAYSTYLGGGGFWECGWGIAVDVDGNVYVTGHTSGSDFPTLNQYQTNKPQYDVFVTKLDPTQSGTASLLYSTYLGGGSHEYGCGIAVDDYGNIYVTGDTYSTDFPTLNQYQSDPGDGLSNVFVSKLDSTQSGTASLLYSTYLGGGSYEIGYGIAVDGNGHIYVTGYTESTDFPTLNEYQKKQSISDGFVTKLDPTKSGADSLLYSTYLGGASSDRGFGIVLDDNGNAYVTGYTRSTDFPTLNHYQTYQGGTDVFVTQLDPGQSGADSLLYSTYLGGGGNDMGNGIARDGNGHIYVAGNTLSSDFPTLNEYQKKQSYHDGFVTKLDPTKSGADSLLYSTYLGGGDSDNCNGIAVDGNGNAYVTGYTDSTDFPTLNEYQSNLVGKWDVFVSKLDPTQSGTASLLYSTYLGGSRDEYGEAVAADAAGNIYVTGAVNSSDFPTHNEYQTDQILGDVFVCKLSPSTPMVTTNAVSNITSTSAAAGGNVIANGGSAVTARGVCWSRLANPDITDNTISNGNGTGSFTSSITGLSPGLTYHVRAYAVNSMGTSYGNDVSFTTTAVLPTVTTTAVSNITSTSADSGGKVTSDGGAAVTARGVCWSTNVNPTTTDSTTSNGTGTGAFTSNMTGLSPGTVYYVRAYATNSVGTSYGGEETFTSGAIVPAVTTTAVTDITSTTSSSGGNVTDTGGSPVTAKGVCWSTSPNPGLSDNKTVDGTGMGSFTSNITGLMENTTYYLRAYTVTITEPQDGAQVSGTVNIKATVTSTSNQANASDASILTVEKVEFYVDDVKIAEDTAEPYETTWDTTTYADGSHTVKAVAYNAANQAFQDEITVHVGNIPPEIMLTRTHLNYGSVLQAGTTSTNPNPADLTTGPQTILLNNMGGGTLNWSVTKDADWLTCEPVSGTVLGAVTVSVDPSGLETGTYNATITIEDPNATNSPQTVPVTLKVYSSGTTTIPFGYFETPLDGSAVRSSVPFTGWALDDIDIASVKIYRAPISGHETGGLVYIGDAVMVDGARPDVEQLYPTYPKDYQAGWGYMMLTNFLPFQGNGTFTIYAIAADKEGNEKTLGSKTITCDNANAVKPFGAIDTPDQGGTAAGSAYVNFGWALTPQPNTIPTDGSTINVWVDGVPLGSPVYNKYREDVATLLPGYNNSDGAGGYFYLDTTAYMNGIHTIAWSVKDNAGNQDGIGSRYFTILNIGSDGSKHSGIMQVKHIGGSIIRHKRSALLPGTVYVRKGYDRGCSLCPSVPSWIKSTVSFTGSLVPDFSDNTGLYLWRKGPTAILLRNLRNW